MKSTFSIRCNCGQEIVLVTMGSELFKGTDQIAVLPPGLEKEAKAVNSDLDEGIEKNLDAALIQSNLHKSVKYEVKSGVVTLTGCAGSA
jgi:hypothetical protein